MKSPTQSFVVEIKRSRRSAPAVELSLVPQNTVSPDRPNTVGRQVSAQVEGDAPLKDKTPSARIHRILRASEVLVPRGHKKDADR